MFYNSLQVDELWTFVGKKENKKWLIYAYSPETKGIVV
ncbi:IS1 family transposase [Capnocytophaga stomatis]|nr:IS1 family transposase [Capnocytophaga stomatis]